MKSTSYVIDSGISIGLSESDSTVISGLSDSDSWSLAPLGDSASVASDGLSTGCTVAESPVSLSLSAGFWPQLTVSATNPKLSKKPCNSFFEFILFFPFL